ncbi:sigma-70 family RNA polymerase sigma factor [Dactylosporangium matsuzakiense]|uniref:RNA polymerase sigma-70 region 2 domain-containing protein n=1 Tax=Dactylosporangium matsuzakiense TaxID=53360 RepID=A0A9W6KQL5_9ACTN|nr:sigma factor [Dactylosporangium matsuzakiense]UWZ44578.1 hypothetical protein Dmats_45775 [Dactylosporangium matsuzakiense]GLL05340.1 hypothetical protein GCM10017581_070870 [Dactylosporangium matsuzakiense]
MTANDDPDRPALRTQTIEAWLGWAYRHALRYAFRRRPIDDLRQVAAYGLIEAVDGYDPWRGARFEPYASVTIRGELKHHFRDQARDLSLDGFAALHAKLVAQARKPAGATSAGKWPTRP